MVSRRAVHAGSWYDNNPRKLTDQLLNWLEAAEFKHPAKALIVPHAGYAYRYFTRSSPKRSLIKIQKTVYL